APRRPALRNHGRAVVPTGFEDQRVKRSTRRRRGAAGDGQRRPALFPRPHASLAVHAVTYARNVGAKLVFTLFGNGEQGEDKLRPYPTSRPPDVVREFEPPKFGPA